MPDHNENGSNRQTMKRVRSAWLIPIGVALLAVIAGFLWAAGVFGNRRSAEERLAEIEAARAIPDSENAARIYDEVMGNLLDDVPSVEQLLPDEKTRERVLCEPWRTQDYPELAAWIDRQQITLAKLAEAARFEKCRFPIPISIDVIDLERAMDAWLYAEWLALAAHYDLGEDRVDAALAKCRRLSQLANHFRQQPLTVDHLMANSLPMLTWVSMFRLVITGNPSETQLQTIEALAQPLTDRWAEYLREICAVEDLQNENRRLQYSVLKRVKSRLYSLFANLTGKGQSQVYEKAGSLYQTNVTMARTLRLFVALRRYRNATGCWPESLDEIKPSLSREILTDPFNKGPFVYKPSGETFILYSKGENNIDEDGRHKSDGPDDWPIWPPRGRIPEAKQEDVNEP